MKAHSFRRNMCAAMLAAIFVLMAVGPLSAQGLKERMAARLPAMEDLKTRGIVGENNRGYLEFVGTPEKAEVVAAENADRQQVYTAIAKQTGTSAEIVGKQRAAQIARQSRPGVRIQAPDGAWYTK